MSRNIYFSRIIKAGDRQREFNFRALPSGNDTRYEVDVPDDRGQRICFIMQRGPEGQWKTDDGPLPEWVMAAEPKLDGAIREHLES
ncbi:MAG: hypothetical protein EOO16_05690 [Chitinophagaceae bacterium]|nr:MAG: hypothetical protein EOO16_05690 [Chitinophagaceae bacterium]